MKNPIKNGEMHSYIPVGISLPNYILSRIDAMRGNVPRSRFILRLLEKIYDKEESK